MQHSPAIKKLHMQQDIIVMLWHLGVVEMVDAAGAFLKIRTDLNELILADMYLIKP